MAIRTTNVTTGGTDHGLELFANCMAVLVEAHRPLTIARAVTPSVRYVSVIGWLLRAGPIEIVRFDVNGGFLRYR